MTTQEPLTSGTQTEAKNESKITERTLLVDESKAIERVKEWGHVVSPVMVYDRWHKLIPSEVHYWEQNGNYKKILKHARAFNPHEEIHAQAETLIQRLGKEYNLNLRNMHYSNNDYNVHFEILSNRFDTKIKNSAIEKDDVVQCGLDLYSGIETSIALGGSMYTYRLSCLNGAVAKGKELGTFSIPGVAKAEDRLKRMEIGFIQVFERFSEIINFYEKLAVIKGNLEMANRFYIKTRAQISDIHMPKGFVIDLNYDEKLKKFQDSNKFMDMGEILNVGLKDPRNAPIPIVAVESGITLWQDFNDITGSVNRKHETKYEKGKMQGEPMLNFSSLANITNAAHKGMSTLVK